MPLGRTSCNNQVHSQLSMILWSGLNESERERGDEEERGGGEREGEKGSEFTIRL